MTAEEKQQDPHFHRPLQPRPKILASVLEAVGQTPCVRINRIGAEEGVECEIIAKCEFFNAGASADTGSPCGSDFGRTARGLGRRRPCAAALSRGLFADGPPGLGRARTQTV